ncbi:MAG: FHIPEP family type III secretion protein [Gemmatimonadaceae bacterium]|nr:FHIPEP family type III secretion protein [Gemmatimonadaceae bacterium]
MPGLPGRARSSACSPGRAGSLLARCQRTARDTPPKSSHSSRLRARAESCPQDQRTRCATCCWISTPSNSKWATPLIPLDGRDRKAATCSERTRAAPQAGRARARHPRAAHPHPRRHPPARQRVHHQDARRRSRHAARSLPRFLHGARTPAARSPEIDGMDTVDPSFGMPAKWIAAPRRTEAEALGFVVVEPTTVVATHLMETLKGTRRRACGRRQECRSMIDTAQESLHPALVDEIIPNKVSLSTLHRVLQRLLRERVPIRDLVTILEALGDGAESRPRIPSVLTEGVRRALTNSISRLFADTTGTCAASPWAHDSKRSLMGLFCPRRHAAGHVAAHARYLATLLRELNHIVTTHAVDGRPLPLITPPSLRVGVRRLIEPVLPNCAVVDRSSPNRPPPRTALWVVLVGTCDSAS